MLETRDLMQDRGEPAKSRPCPNCGRPMHFMGGFAPLVLVARRHYRCGECGVSVADHADG
jgi:ribosomal protein S27AE